MLVPARVAAEHVAVARERAAGDRHGRAGERRGCPDRLTDRPARQRHAVWLGDRTRSVAAPLSVGASLTAVMLIVVVWAVLRLNEPRRR